MYLLICNHNTHKRHSNHKKSMGVSKNGAAENENEKNNVL